VEKFNLIKLSDAKGNDQYYQVSNKSADLKSLDDNVDIKAVQSIFRQLMLKIITQKKAG
jgi:hypothetical protein